MTEQDIFKIFRYGWWDRGGYNYETEELAEINCERDFIDWKNEHIMTLEKLLNCPAKDQTPFLKAYKKRNKNLQRRFEIQYQVNRKLISLLKVAQKYNNNEVLQNLIDEELNLLHYKYY